MEIVRNPDRNRFELVHDGAVIGTLAYSYDGDVTVLERIEVDEKYSGQGLAGEFTEAVLSSMRLNEEAVLPQCPYVRGWILKHPQFRDVVPPDIELSA